MGDIILLVYYRGFNSIRNEHPSKIFNLQFLIIWVYIIFLLVFFVVVVVLLKVLKSSLGIPYSSLELGFFQSHFWMEHIFIKLKKRKSS